MNDLVEITPDGRMRLHFHRGQAKAWNSQKRFVVVLAGTQGGKTTFGPHWLYREIQKRGPGDYMVVTPTYPLLELKALPAFKSLFETALHLGRYVGSPVRKFLFSPSGEKRTFGDEYDAAATSVYFGHAQDPESLESATAKGAWLDEAGQKKFKLGSWEAIRRRLSIHRGRALLTTTPYDLGWLKIKLFDKGMAGDPDIGIIRFDSTQNPSFPQQEFEDARRDLPLWKFNMFYRAIFTRPAGLIYDVFDEEMHKVPRFTIPNAWPRYLGLDFGGVNTAGLFYAEELEPLPAKRGEEQWGEPTGKMYLYRAYKTGGRTAREHAAALLAGEPGRPTTVGGSKSEGQWRGEFRAAGLPVREPKISDVEVGITRVYGFHKRGDLYVFDDLDGYLAEKMSYSRVLNEFSEPTEEIDDKSSFHFMDAERYILGWLAGRNRRWRNE